ncbi:phosphomannomutase CpsG [Shewanella sp. 202IG2-18]|uniref:phosphomannomutase CpsG n=1 Tax=Parashewanella hymeniacidonis TaxID=2807618 RepID=UPI001961117A|nr:phosphomannomutase CpsG [Parashewanella hymeniacidonis]MBM7072038.1 phosphomannomutase CpsG [Parashewanella hymeniacidonis]
MKNLTCFKAYDIRGRLPDELNTDIAWCIGRAMADYLKPNNIVVGGDIRLTSSELKHALADGLRSGGTNVTDIGLCGTEEIYFATSLLKVDGGVMVTASHNPMDYNGMKLVREQSKPISGDTGLLDIKKLAEQYYFDGKPEPVADLGEFKELSTLKPYIQHLFEYVDVANFKPLKLVVNAGNGAAGHVVNALETAFTQQNVPVEFVKVHNQPNGNFPNGIPNPLLPDNRDDTILAVKEHGADFGIAWDGDFDRCFLFDENGDFIEGYYIVGLLAEAFLQKHPESKIIHDPRLTWNTVDIVESNGGNAVQSKTGHAFIKERMRSEDAIYGGEMSAHHYFRDFAYCDSGMIPWLLVAELVSIKGQPLSELVKERMAAYPSPGEINRTVDDADKVIERVLAIYEKDAVGIDRTDGISLNMGNWRFNLRKSNTEPVIRLNLESRGDVALMKQKTEEVLALIEG